MKLQTSKGSSRKRKCALTLSQTKSTTNKWRPRGVERIWPNRKKRRSGLASWQTRRPLGEQLAEFKRLKKGVWLVLKLNRKLFARNSWNRRKSDSERSKRRKRKLLVASAKWRRRKSHTKERLRNNECSV